MNGSRDERAVSSHAQKHFIRLCLQGRPLPAKVAESGEGYTLSGKPLDPNSSAARQYGFKPDTLQARALRPGGNEKRDAGHHVLDSQSSAATHSPCYSAHPPVPRPRSPPRYCGRPQKLEEAFGADVLGGLTANSDPADGAPTRDADMTDACLCFDEILHMCSIGGC